MNENEQSTCNNEQSIPTGTNTSSINCDSSRDDSGENTLSPNELLRESIVAEFQPQIDALNAEKATLLQTVEQYKSLLKNTVRTDADSSNVDKPKPIKFIPASHILDWHSRK